MTREMAKNVAVVAVWLLLVAVGCWFISKTVEDSDATPPGPTPSGERAEPCDRACNEWIDIQGSSTQHPTAAQLMAGHGCWLMRDGAPGNVDGIPGGAVVRVDGAEPEYTENATLIAWALDAALDGADNGVTAVAFCRGDS